MVTIPVSTELQATISAANDTFMAAFARGDAKGLAELYTAEGQVLAPNAEIVSGQKALEGFWQALFGMGIKQALLEIQELEDHGDTAIEVSNYTLKGAEGQVLDQGKYIVIWKLVDGDWKLHRDIFNSSLPAPGS